MRLLLTLFIALLLLASCGIQKNTEDTLGEVRKSNDSMGQMLEVTRQMRELTTQVRDATLKMQQLTTQVNEKTTRVVKSTDQVNEKTGKVIDLTSKVNEKTGQVVSLTSQVNERTAQVATLTAQLKDLTERVAALSKALDDKTDKVKAYSAVIAEGVHKQTLLNSLQGLFDPKNTENLRAPLKMLSFAQTFALEATVDELMGEFHILISDVLQGGINDMPNPTAADYRIQSRNIDLVAASAIAAFTPDDKFSTILAQQVERGGQFKDSAMLFALTRYTFIRDFFFSAVTQNSRTVDLGSLKAAVGYYKQMRFVESLPYASKLSLEAPNMIQAPGEASRATFLAFTMTLEPLKLRSAASAAIRRFKKEPSLQTPEALELINQLKQ